MRESTSWKRYLRDIVDHRFYQNSGRLGSVMVIGRSRESQVSCQTDTAVVQLPGRRPCDVSDKALLTALW